MLTKELVEEAFFPFIIRKEGHYLPAPPQVRERVRKMKSDLLERYPRGSRAKVCVSMLPLINGENQGFMVKGEIYHVTQVDHV